jgi:hypothetical protein
MHLHFTSARQVRLPYNSESRKVSLVSEFQFGGEFVWYPSPERVATSNLQQFIDKHQVGSYDELMRHAARTGVTRPTNETPTHADW